MENILLIHTVLSKAIVALSNAGNVADIMFNEDQKSHGAFLHEAIDALLANSQLQPADLNAIAVTTGPGSYTGIRVGLSAAKGIAFALQKPVIPVSTMELLAATAIDKQQEDGLYMPLIHARLTEYFAGWYDVRGRAMNEDTVIDMQGFTAYKEDDVNSFYFGPGITEATVQQTGYKYLNVPDVSEMSFGKLAHNKFITGAIASAASVNPSYLKAAYTTSPRRV